MILLSSSAFDDSRLLPFLFCTLGKMKETTRVSIVVSASPMKAKGPSAIKTMNYLIQNNVSDLRFVDLCEGRSAKERLQNSDVILLNGGNPFLLLATLQQQDYLEELKTLGSSERVIVGVSAGGMMFSPGLQLVQRFNELLGFDDKGNTEGVEDLNCLNFFDEYFFPHIDLFSQKVPGLSANLDLIEVDERVTLYRQNNGQTARVHHRRIEEIWCRGHPQWLRNPFTSPHNPTSESASSGRSTGAITSANTTH